MTTRRPGEQVGFGAVTPGEAQAENPAHEDAMIDDGVADGASPEDVVRGLFETVFNEGDLDAIERFVAPDHRNHDPTAPPAPPGPQGVRKLVEDYREAFPDLRIQTEEIFASGDLVAHRWTLTGTQRGEIMGISPTGRRVEVSGIEINRIDRGKIADSWALSDVDGMREQLGG
jgi:steroid delta-isomerase-like uncharacterized protein